MNYLLILIPILGLLIYASRVRKIFLFGVFFHELGHYIFAKILGLKVFRTKWLSSIEVEEPDSAWKALLVCFGPFIFSFILAAIILHYTLSTQYDVLGVFISTGIVLNSPSSKQDFKNFLDVFIDVFRGKGGLLDYIILMAISAVFVLSVVGYLSFNINYLLLIAVMIVAFVILSVTTIFGEIANALLLILMIFVMSGEVDVPTIAQNFKIFLDDILLLIDAVI